MSLADERRSKRHRDGTSLALETRICAFFVGALFLIGSAYAMRASIGDLQWWNLAVLALLAAGGVWFVWVALFGSEAQIEKAAAGLGSHEVVLVIFAISFPVAWLIRLFSRK